MYLLLILAFVGGYIFIALEHVVKVDKAASALITGVVCWTIMISSGETFFSHELSGPAILEHVDESLLHHLGEIAEILFFLMAAMTIVELIDSHLGFNLVTNSIRTTHKVRMMWMVCIITFFLSALLDNLTTTIVMATLLRKLIKERSDLWFYGGMVVIAANAGGAWSPIGDVTTIMLWIGGQISAVSIIVQLILPSLLCLMFPLLVLSLTMKGHLEKPEVKKSVGAHKAEVTGFEQKLVFSMGILGLLFVPVFKNLTHLPPFMGMLGSLSVLWIVTEILHRKKSHEDSEGLTVADIIRRIDTPSILFFLGILLAVAGLQTTGILLDFAQVIDRHLGNIYLINLSIGLLSAIVDNVPLVAGAMGMYSMDVYPQDHRFWELLAYCAGTGGSVLIIGSAAGVAMMGLLRIDFIWYLKRVSLLALLGYLAGLLWMYLIS
jgi:Na+/H+ antiporter NhaD/arsenite permease-like protein